MILFTLLVITMLTPIYGSKQHHKLHDWFRTCQEKTNASEADFELVRQRQIPDSEEGICMIECLFTKLHIVENGKFNKNGFITTFSPLVITDRKRLTALKEIANICQKVSLDEHPQGCNITKLVLDCFGKTKDKLGKL